MTRVLKHLSWCATGAALALLVATTSASADSCKSQGNGIKNCDTPPVVSATPELDSAFLFGTGILGAASYVALRIRARRRD